MECTWYLLLFSSLFLAAGIWLRSRFKTVPNQRPAGPPGWPIVGNMFDLGNIPHQTLYKLRFKYGPVLWLKLGSVNTMVVQSAEAASELFKNHDQDFCDRMNLHVFTAHGYRNGSLAVGHYGTNWRALRRLCSMELFATKHVNSMAPIRRKCVDDMVRYIEEESAAGVARGESGEVDLPRFLFLMAFNVVSNLTLSKDLLDPRSEKCPEFYDAMDNFMKWAGTPNVADFFPWLQWMDPQGLKKKMTRDMGQALKIISDFVNERVEEQKNLNGKDPNPNRDFLDALLENQSDGKEGSYKISDHNIHIIIMEMFFAGSETTSSTLEWAMAELLRNPESMSKVKEELNQVVERRKKVEESDIDQLPYLQAVLKEVLRLHPPIPQLIPRNTLEDTKFMEYLIPKDTQVFVNAWAIGRDPDVWEDPLSFKPERFLGSDIEYKGRNCELIPFGSGRRICIGILVGHKVLHLALASLLHHFDWKLEKGLSPESIDLSERIGITVRKFLPLRAIPIKRSV